MRSLRAVLFRIAASIVSQSSTHLISSPTIAPLSHCTRGTRAWSRGAWTAFPDYHEELDGLIAEGTRVVRGDRDSRDSRGEIRRQGGIPDNLSALRQLGVVPTRRP
jgi:hypothetical protein